jgi:hypothetical protein
MEDLVPSGLAGDAFVPRLAVRRPGPKATQSEIIVIT